MLDTVVEGLRRNAGELVRGRRVSEERISVRGGDHLQLNNWRAVLGQSNDPGMRGTGTRKGCVAHLPSFGSGDCEAGAGIVEVDAASREGQLWGETVERVRNEIGCAKKGEETNQKGAQQG